MAAHRSLHLPGASIDVHTKLPIDRVSEVVRSVLPVAPKWLLTTRPDNDDGVHPEFVATLQRAQRFKQAEVLNLPLGIILSGERAYDQPFRAFSAVMWPTWCLLCHSYIATT